jgi:uncharacterized protein YigA (DUF484 family)
MNPIEVASYLANNPHFFEQHADLFSTIKLVSPILGRTISLQERQMEVVRDKYRQLELRLTELIRIAQENDATAAKMNKWTQALLLARNDVDLPHIFTTSMQSIFNLPHATIRCWNVSEEYSHTWFAAPVSDDVRLFAGSLTAPFCGKNMDFEAATWLQTPDDAIASVASIAMLPLRHNDKVFGLVVLGSPDPERYTSTMATNFLTQIAEISSAALRFVVD